MRPVKTIIWLYGPPPVLASEKERSERSSKSSVLIVLLGELQCILHDKPLSTYETGLACFRCLIWKCTTLCYILLATSDAWDKTQCPRKFSFPAKHSNGVRSVEEQQYSCCFHLLCDSGMKSVLSMNLFIDREAEQLPEVLKEIRLNKIELLEMQWPTLNRIEMVTERK